MQQKSELPEGWALTSLSDCVDILDNLRVPINSTEREKRAGNVPYYGATGQVGWIDDFLFDEELLLLGEDGAPFFDKTKSIAYLIHGKSWVNNHAHVLRAIGNLTSNIFLKNYLDYFDFNGFVTGTTRYKLNQSSMKGIPLPLPPLPEQHRIVSAIEALFARLDATNEKLDRLPEILKKFRESVLAAACGGKLTEDWRKQNPYVEDAKTCINNIIQERKEEYLSTAELTNEGKRKKPKLERCKNASKNIFNLPYSWDICFFEDIAENKKNAIKAGPFGSSLTKGCYVKEGFKVYGQEQVIRNDAFYGDYYISEEKYFELESCKIEPKDILISLVGTIGKVLILPENCKPGIINPRLVKISLNEKISRLYIKIYLESPYVKSLVSSNSHGGTMEILNLKIIKSFPIPLPSLPEQQEIVRRVDALFAFADAIEAKVAAAREKTEKLRLSILAKAFSGELVETEAEIARREGRDYETAEVLIERIKAENREKRK